MLISVRSQAGVLDTAFALGQTTIVLKRAIGRLNPRLRPIRMSVETNCCRVQQRCPCKCAGGNLPGACTKFHIVDFLQHPFLYSCGKRGAVAKRANEIPRFLERVTPQYRLYRPIISDLVLGNRLSGIQRDPSIDLAEAY
jgi:hypothetical protein